MKVIMLAVIAFVLGIVGTLIFLRIPSQKNPVALLVQPIPVPTPLSVYSFDSLRSTVFSPSPIVLGEKLGETQDEISQLFTFTFAPNPSSTEKKIVSGVVHLPKKPGMYPVILMLRGYIPQETYTEGAGTNPSARIFASKGFITIAPDFLGFGRSDARGDDEYENRFQTYTTSLTLLSSLSSLSSGLDASSSGTIRADTSKVGIWGHSNGGHIALSVLAITGRAYPTVLWAPVSKSFPYSVLAYTDEDEDLGKGSRKSLSNFEQVYDSAAFDPAMHYDWIHAPIQLHQGTADEEVPYWWSDELVDTLKKNGTDVEYHKYAGSDHNLRRTWNDVVKNSVEYFKKHLNK